MDNKLFDAMVRGAVGAASRRGVLRIGIGTVAASALGVRGLNAEQFAHARKKKKGGRRREIDAVSSAASRLAGSPAAMAAV